MNHLPNLPPRLTPEQIAFGGMTREEYHHQRRRRAAWRTGIGFILVGMVVAVTVAYLLSLWLNR